MNNDFHPDGQIHPCELCPGLFTARLANGLRVIIRENHRAPVAICNVWVGAGSNREPAALRGWSHGIEHLLFKGTTRRGEGDFAREVAEAGGSTNAGTGYESTNYHITVPANELAVAVDILSDVPFHSTFEPAALDAEREVLVHENHMYDDVPFGYGITWRWGLDLAFSESPYRHPIGGRDENLRERSREQIMAYWRSAYRPDNMVVVAVGDFTAEDAFALIREKFATASRPPETPAPETAMVASPGAEPRHDGPRLRTEKGDIKKCYAKLVFSAPGHGDDPDQVMAVINQILSEGRSSRIYREIQETKHLIDDFVVMGEAGPREGVFVIDLETDTQRLPAAMRAVVGVLEDLKRTGGTDEELERARVRVLRAFHFGAETVQGQARLMGSQALLDDLEGAFTFPARIGRVTRGKVAELAGQVFARDQISVVIYSPEDADTAGHPTDPDSLADMLKDSLTNDGGGEIASDTVTGFQVMIALGGEVLPFVTETLSCGAEICYRIDRTLPVVTLAVTSVGGACGETAATSGLTSLSASVQVKGAAGMDSAVLHGRLEAAGASISPVTDRDFTGLIFSGLIDRLDGPLNILADIIGRADFAADEIEQERRLALEELASLEDNPLQLGVVKLREMLYGDHPYGRPLVGTSESLPRLDRRQVTDAHSAVWRPQALQIVVSGDIHPEKLLPRLDKMLTGLPAGVAERPDPGPAHVRRDAELVRLRRRINQCVLLVGWPGPRNPDEMRPARMLYKEILNGQSGRLFEELRNRRSLCYNTGVMTTAGFGQGMFLGYVLTAPESEDAARETLLAELDRMVDEPVAAEELERARAKLCGNLAIGSQSNSSRISRAMRNRVYGRPADDLGDLIASLQAVTPADIQAVSASLVRSGRCEVVVGPRE